MKLFEPEYYNIIKKIEKTIYSCKTDAQLSTAKKMIDNFEKFSHNLNHGYDMRYGMDNIWTIDKFVNHLTDLLLKQMSEIHKNDETCGAKLRNKLTPYCVLLDIVKEYSKGNIDTEKFLDMLYKEDMYNNIEDLKNFANYLDKFIYDYDEEKH